MLDKLLRSFRNDGTADRAPDRESDLQMAIAALLVEAARADGDYTDQERDMIDHMLGQRFGLDAGAARDLRDRAEIRQAEANDLYGFSRVVKDEMPRDEKIAFIEEMWLIALSDEERAPHEEMVIRRLVGLIYLEDTDSAAARRRAAERLGQRARPRQTD